MDEKKNKDVDILHDNNLTVNNNFRFNIHFGDSLNLLALVVGLFAIKTVSKHLSGKPLTKNKPRKSVQIR